MPPFRLIGYTPRFHPPPPPFFPLGGRARQKIMMSSSAAEDIKSDGEAGNLVIT